MLRVCDVCKYVLDTDQGARNGNFVLTEHTLVHNNNCSIYLRIGVALYEGFPVCICTLTV